MARTAPPSHGGDRADEDAEQDGGFEGEIGGEEVLYVEADQTPRVRGIQIMATSPAVWRQLRWGLRRSFLNVAPRARMAAKDAATPSSTSRVIRISLGSA